MNFRLTGLLAIALASFAASGHAAGVKGQGTWETTLQARDIDGDGTTDAFYDTELKVTWLRAGSTDLMNWTPADAWAKQDRFGLSGWRLPNTVDTGFPGCNWSFGGTDCGFNPDSSVSTGSEMAHLFFQSLGNKSRYAPGTGAEQEGYGLTNTGDFQNLQTGAYWSNEYAPGSNGAWTFFTNYGEQGLSVNDFSFYALAVRDGDVATAVPEPQTYALLLAGLGLMCFVARRRSKQQ